MPSGLTAAQRYPPADIRGAVPYHVRDVPGLNPGWAGGTANVARTLAIPRALRSILRSSHLYLGDSVTGEFRMLLSYLCFVTVRLLLCRSLPGATPNTPFLLECSRHFLMLVSCRTAWTSLSLSPSLSRLPDSLATRRSAAGGPPGEGCISLGPFPCGFDLSASCISLGRRCSRERPAGTPAL